MLPRRTTVVVDVGRVRHTHQPLCSLTRAGRYRHADRYRSDLHPCWSVPRHHLRNVDLPVLKQRVRTICIGSVPNHCDKYDHNHTEAAFLRPGTRWVNEAVSSRMFL